MALIGRIGTDGTPFLVGSAAQVTAAATGLVYLAPNDEWYLMWGNAGSLTVSIWVGGTGGAGAPMAEAPDGGAPIRPEARPGIVPLTACDGFATAASPLWLAGLTVGGSSCRAGVIAVAAAGRPFGWLRAVPGSAAGRRQRCC